MVPEVRRQPKIDVHPSGTRGEPCPVGRNGHPTEPSLDTVWTLLAQAVQQVRKVEMRTRLGSPLDAFEIARRCDAIRGSTPFREVAEGTGAHPETVRRYLRGRGRIPADFVARFAAMFHVDPLSLMFGYKYDDGHALSERQADASLGVILSMVRGLLLPDLNPSDDGHPFAPPSSEPIEHAKAPLARDNDLVRDPASQVCPTVGDGR